MMATELYFVKHLLQTAFLSAQDGKTPLYTAAEWGEMDVARVLLQYGTNAKLSSNVSYYNMALMLNSFPM